MTLMYATPQAVQPWLTSVWLRQTAGKTKTQANNRTEQNGIAWWFFNRLGEIAAEYLRKGSQVYVEGRLQTRKWQDKEGNDRYTTEIVANEMQMLGGRASGGAPGGDYNDAPPASQASGSSRAPAAAAPIADDGFDDDIPF